MLEKVHQILLLEALPQRSLEQILLLLLLVHWLLVGLAFLFLFLLYLLHRECP